MEDNILKAKAEIFDILEAQAQLNARLQQLEKLKDEKYKAMNELRSQNTKDVKESAYPGGSPPKEKMVKRGSKDLMKDDEV